MADERSTPLNQGVDKWLQVTSQGELQTWDGNTTNFYEEGEFTAQFTPQNGSFNSVDYRRNNGVYRKIGNFVCVEGYIDVNSIDTGDASGQLNVALPFTSVSSPIIIYSGSVSRYRGMGGNGISIQINPNTNNARVRKEIEANFTDDDVDPQDLGRNTILSFSLSYKI